MMNSFATWTGRRNKPLTKIHVRPKRNLYSKLREQTVKRDPSTRQSGYNESELTTSCTLNFLATDDDSSEEEIVTYELSSMKSLRSGNSNQVGANLQRRPMEINFVEKEIEAEDTLHKLALRYGCKVSEIKRINNLINDQEFYGLRRIKVPVKEHGYAKEQLDKENQQKMKNIERKERAHLSMDGNGQCASNDNTKVISIRDNRNAKEFLQQMDADLERIRKSTKTEKDSLEEVTMSLTCKRFHPFSEYTPTRNFPQLRILILVIILALIAFPVIIILLMIYRRSSDAFHTNFTHFQKPSNSSGNYPS